MADQKLSGLDVVTAILAANKLYTEVSGVSKAITFANLALSISSSSKAELDILDGATVDVTELNYLDGTVPGTAVASKVLALGATKNIDTIDIAKDGLLIATVAVTTTAAELNILDGVTGVTAAEISYLGDVTGLIQAQIDLKSPIASPAFTGVPTAPTPATVTDTTQLATTEFVNNVAFSTSLPAQVAGNALTSDGVDAAFDLEVADLAKNSNNLANLASAATSRTNLGVYGTSEVYTTSETEAAIQAGSGLVHLQTVVASAASSIFISPFSADYDEYLLVGELSWASSSGVIELTYFKGSEITTGTYDFSSQYFRPENGQVWNGTPLASGTGAASIQIGGTLTAILKESFSIKIHNPLNASFGTAIDWESRHYGTAAAQPAVSTGGGYNPSATAMTGLYLRPSSATFTGTVRLYGMSKYND